MFVVLDFVELEGRFVANPSSVSGKELSELEEFFSACIDDFIDAPPGKKTCEGLDKYKTLYANVLVEQQLRGI